MAKLKGPLFSTTATGALAKLLDYSSRRRGPIAGAHRRPRQPRTIAQRATRIFMAWLTAEWRTCSSAEKASWYLAPNAVPTSPYHAYLQHNVCRFSLMPDVAGHPHETALWPSAAWPTTNDTLYNNLSSGSAWGGPGTITHRYWNAPANDGWFASYHLEVPGINYCTYRNLVYMQTELPSGWHEIVIPNMPAGLQKIRIICASRTGWPIGTTYVYTATVT